MTRPRTMTGKQRINLTIVVRDYDEPLANLPGKVMAGLAGQGVQVVEVFSVEASELDPGKVHAIQAERDKALARIESLRYSLQDIIEHAREALSL